MSSWQQGIGRDLLPYDLWHPATLVVIEESEGDELLQIESSMYKLYMASESFVCGIQDSVVRAKLDHLQEAVVVDWSAFRERRLLPEARVDERGEDRDVLETVLLEG